LRLCWTKEAVEGGCQVTVDLRDCVRVAARH